MRRLLPHLVALLLVPTWLSPVAAAPTPAQLCESAMELGAAKYAQCRLTAQSKDAKAPNPAKLSDALGRCSQKLSDAFAKATLRYGAACAATEPSSAFDEYLKQCSDDTVAAAGGAALPDYSGDLATCNASVSTCNGSLTTCSGSLSTCNGSLTTCNTSLSSTQSSLTTCNGNLSTCSGNLTTCTGNLGTCDANLTSAQANVATCNAGSAELGDVLPGKTFSSSAGLGVTGTMPNNGAVTLTPALTVQTIPAGYHNGAGTVAGDADLVAGNIVAGVNIFDVTGTALPAPLLKTGQTTSYGAGSDGDLQKGIAQGYVDNGDGTITDTKTGLMWEKKSDDGSIHDKDRTYTWGINTPPYTMNGTAVTAFLATLNAGGGFAGYTDWRLPNLTELESIRNLQTFSPETFPAFNTACAPACTVLTCSCTASSVYRSSSSFASNPQNAWVVNFYNGEATAGDKLNGYYVRAVRAGS